MPNVMAAQPNIGGVAPSAKVLQFHSLYTTPRSLADARCWMQSEFLHVAKFRQGQKPQKCIHSVPAQETAKDRAKYRWPAVSDVAAVMKPRR